jgi:hypothetical protein
VAAEADAALSSNARESVLAAHLAICMMKAGAWPQPVVGQ